MLIRKKPTKGGGADGGGGGACKTGRKVWDNKLKKMGCKE
jgi:hypothetical protein